MKCQYEACNNEAEITITDKETLREIEICKECYEMLNDRDLEDRYNAWLDRD
jgi:hypothetical protein